MAPGSEDVHIAAADFQGKEHVERFDRKHSGGGKLTDLSAHAVDALESIVGEVEHVESATFRDVRRVG